MPQPSAGLIHLGSDGLFMSTPKNPLDAPPIFVHSAAPPDLCLFSCTPQSLSAQLPLPQGPASALAHWVKSHPSCWEAGGFCPGKARPSSHPSLGTVPSARGSPSSVPQVWELLKVGPQLEVVAGQTSHLPLLQVVSIAGRPERPSDQPRACDVQGPGQWGRRGDSQAGAARAG